MKRRRLLKLTSVILALFMLVSCAPKGTENVSSLEKQWVLGEAVIPENNPEPVSVNREDAATPTPISYTDKIVGEEIEFNEKTIDVHSTNKEEWDHHIAVVGSHNELQSIYDQDYRNFKEENQYINFYDDFFFKENILVVLFRYSGLSAFEYKIDKVTVTDGCMYIYLNHIDLHRYGGYMAVATNFRTFISISRKDLENIKDIVVYMDEVYLEEKS